MELRDRILVVDDDPMNIRVLVELLQTEFTLSIARSGEEALELLGKGSLPELILLDIMMPGLDGYGVCARLKANASWAPIPVMFITALNQSFDETRGFEAGAVDYISKPVVPPVLLARVRTQMSLRRAQRELMQHNEQLEHLVQARTHEVLLTQEVMMRALSNLSELREGEGDYVRRIQHGVLALARAIQSYPTFAWIINQQFLDRLFRSAGLQNIGMMGLPHAIIKKQTERTPEEEALYRRHPEIGRDALMASLAAEATETIEFLQVAVDMVGAHHESWDGTGYPDGLRGEEIPLSARILRLVNAYNDGISQDGYNGPGAHERAIELIRVGSGRDFDPRLVAAFLSVSEEFRLIAIHYAD